jgi:hypothetical protein
MNMAPLGNAEGDEHTSNLDFLQRMA